MGLGQQRSSQSVQRSTEQAATMDNGPQIVAPAEQLKELKDTSTPSHHKSRCFARRLSRIRNDCFLRR